MRSWWPRAFALLLLGTWGGTPACSGSSKSNGTASGGTSNDAGRGGDTSGGVGGAAGGAGGTTTGGAGGSSGAPGGAAGSSAGGSTAAASGTAGLGGNAGSGLGGAPSAGTAGATAGAAGDPSDAGEGGAPTCRDFCTTAAPACCAPGLDCIERVERCRIDVLTKRIDHGPDYEGLKTKIAAIPEDALVSIGDDDVAAAAADPSSAPRFRFQLTEAASNTVANALMNTNGFPFRVSCGEEELFVGVIYMREGAAALRIPVIHVDASASPIALLLGAYQGAWYPWTSPDPGAAPDLTGRIDRPELRAAFCERGILEELGEVLP